MLRLTLGMKALICALLLAGLPVVSQQNLPEGPRPKDQQPQQGVPDAPQPKPQQQGQFPENAPLDCRSGSITGWPERREQGKKIRRDKVLCTYHGAPGDQWTQKRCTDPHAMVIRDYMKTPVTGGQPLEETGPSP